VDFTKKIIILKVKGIFMNKFLLISIILIGVVSCKSMQSKNIYEQTDDITMHLEHAQSFARKENFTEAINILNNYKTNYPNINTFTIDYNIGFYYFKLNDYKSAKVYFERIVNNYLNAEVKEQNENYKFVILSESLINKINDVKYKNDPYRIQDEKPLVIKPKK